MQSASGGSRTITVKRLIVVLLAVVVVAGLIGAAGAAAKILRQPVQGTVLVTVPVQPVQDAAATSSQTHAGKYVSYTYPASYELQKLKPEQRAGLDNQILRASTPSTSLLLVTVSDLPSGRLEDDPSYLLRKSQPDAFTLKPITVQGEAAVLAESRREQSRIVFWPHGGKLLLVSLTGVYKDPQTTDAAVRQLVDSVSWK